MKGRNFKNKVVMLVDDNGREQFSEGYKGNIAADFFRALFTSTNPSDFEPLFDGFNTRVTASIPVLWLQYLQKR